MMNADGFVEWKEVFISQEKGNRVVHYYFKDTNGNSVLAVIGTERSVRHMVYIVADEFFHAYGTERNITAGFKWRSKREVVDWLTCSLVKHHFPREYALAVSPKNDPRQALGFSDFSMNGFDAPRGHQLSDHTSQIACNLESYTSDISWSGDSWICSKQLTHYPAFSRNGITIDVNVLMHTTEVEIASWQRDTCIQDVHHFGLAQLYQLRGRVGRADKEAHAHLFYPDKSLLSDQALEWLAALEECTDLGHLKCKAIAQGTLNTMSRKF